MLYRVTADIILVTHLGFIVFVVLGAILVLYMPRLVWLHVPSALWGAYVEIAGRVCPLTYAENYLRLRAGQEGLQQSFIEHYLLPVIYPSGLTKSVQFTLAALVILVNVLLYSWILLRRPKTRINVP